jgi:hypothetical protein
MINEYGAIGGMRIGRGKRSIQRKEKPPVPPCPPQFPYDQFGIEPRPLLC